MSLNLIYQQIQKPHFEKRLIKMVSLLEVICTYFKCYFAQVPNKKEMAIATP